MLPRTCQQCFGPLNMLISKGSSETWVLGHSSNHIFPNQRLQTYSKYSKFYLHKENAHKVGEDVDSFEYNCVWTCCGSFCQLWQQYMWSAVNVVESCFKISDTTRKHDTQLSLFDINGKLAKKYSRADFSSVLDALTD